MVLLSGPSRSRQKRHLAGVLDGLRDETLLLHGDTGDATGADLSALRDELPKGRDILVVDDADLDGLRGGAAFFAPLPPRGLRRSPLLFPAMVLSCLVKTIRATDVSGCESSDRRP